MKTADKTSIDTSKMTTLEVLGLQDNLWAPLLDVIESDVKNIQNI